MSLKRLKSTYVINELGKISQGEIIKDLKCNKTCAVVVKYFDKERESMETRLLDLLNIYNSDINEGEGSTGNTFSNFLNEHQISIDNLIGFAGDGASNIMGPLNSVTSRLRNVAPGITILKCICHSVHLCTSQAAKTLPRACEDLGQGHIHIFLPQRKKET